MPTAYKRCSLKNAHLKLETVIKWHEIFHRWFNVFQINNIITKRNDCVHLCLFWISRSPRLSHIICMHSLRPTNGKSAFQCIQNTRYTCMWFLKIINIVFGWVLSTCTKYFGIDIQTYGFLLFLRRVVHKNSK